MPNLYASLADLKQHVGIDDTQDDALLLTTLEAASRQIDLCTRHQFFVTEGTRRFTAARSDSLILKNADLLAVTSLQTDSGGDRTYSSTWAETDYDLGPAEAPYDSPPAPYWRIDRVSGGAYSFLAGVPLGAQITGRWGYYEVLERADATVNGDHDATTTTLQVSGGIKVVAGLTVRIGAEQLEVLGRTGNTVTVVRGVNGTTAAAILDGTAVDVYTYPVVHEACLLQAGRLWTRKDSPVGWVGSSEIGVARVWSQLDPDARMLLSPLRAVGVF